MENQKNHKTAKSKLTGQDPASSGDKNSENFSSNRDASKEPRPSGEKMNLYTLDPYSVDVIMGYMGVGDRFNTIQAFPRLLKKAWDEQRWWSHVELSITSMEDSSDRRVGHLRKSELQALHTFGHLFQHVTLYARTLFLHAKVFGLLYLRFCHTPSELKSLRIVTDHGLDILCETRDKADTQLPPRFPLLGILCGLLPLLDVEKSMSTTFTDTVGLSPFRHLPSTAQHPCHVYTDVLRVDLQYLQRQDDRVISPVAELVSRFSRLKQLSVRMANVQDDLLDELTTLCLEHGQFRNLVIDCANDANTGRGVSSLAWTRLTSACPRLKVFCVNLDSFCYLERFAKPNVPIRGLEVRGLLSADFDVFPFSNYSHQLKYMFWGLKRINPCVDIEALLDAMRASPRLEHFVYAGALIRCRDVVRLAAEKRDQWVSFVIPESAIASDKDADRQLQLKIMKDLVSRYLGYSWCPETTNDGSLLYEMYVKPIKVKEGLVEDFA